MVVRPAQRTNALRLFCARAKALCEAGALDTDLAQAFGIALGTMYRWRTEFREFREATKAVLVENREFAVVGRGLGKRHERLGLWGSGGHAGRGRWQ